MATIDKTVNDATGKISDVAGKAAELVYGKGNIDAMRASISKHAGPAKQNRFQVIFTPPGAELLNQNKTDIAGSIVSGGFDVRSLVNDPRDISLLATRASFPSWGIPTFEYQTTGQVNKFPYTFIHEDLTLSFLCTNDYYIKKMFDVWMNGVMDVNSHTASYKDNYVTDIVVAQLNEKHIPVYSYKFVDAFPTIVTAIEFSQDGTDLVKFDVTFAFDKFVPEGVIDSALSGVSNGFGKLGLPGGGSIAQKAGSITKSIGNKFKL